MIVNNPPVFDQITSTVGAVTGDILLTSLDTVDYDGAGAGLRIKVKVYDFANFDPNDTTSHKYISPAGLGGKTILAIYGVMTMVNGYGTIGVYDNDTALSHAYIAAYYDAVNDRLGLHPVESTIGMLSHQSGRLVVLYSD